MTVHSKLPNTELAVAVRKLRGGRTQEQFASDVGVARQAVNRWESGHKISLRNLQKLVRIGLDATHLLGGTTLPTVLPDPESGNHQDGRAA